MQCPRCQSEAVYKYGFSKKGEQRYRCVQCFYQFVQNPSKRMEREKPDCPLCGAVMHVHHRTEEGTAYRCSKYPECRGYLSKNTEQEKLEQERCQES